MNQTSQVQSVQRNSLSESAKNYKRNVTAMYKTLLDEIGFTKITQLSEVRLIAQPPTKTKKYSATTYPRYDIDNYPKLIIDTLKDLFIKDDNIFIKENIQLAKPIDEGCVWVSILTVQQEDWLQQDVDFDWLKGGINVT